MPIENALQIQDRRQQIIENVLSVVVGNPMPHVVENVTNEELDSLHFNDEVIITISGIDGVKGADIPHLEQQFNGHCLFADELKPKVELLLATLNRQQRELNLYAPAFIEMYKLAIDKSFWSDIFGNFNVNEIIEMSDNDFVAAIVAFLNKKSDILKTLKTGDKKQKGLTAPAISLFCSIIADTGLVPYEPNDSAIPYCKRVCEKYNLPYSDNVRQIFKQVPSFKSGNKDLKKITEHILPLLQENDMVVIEKYIQDKTSEKQVKLYV